VILHRQYFDAGAWCIIYHKYFTNRKRPSAHAMYIAANMRRDDQKSPKRRARKHAMMRTLRESQSVCPLLNKIFWPTELHNVNLKQTLTFSHRSQKFALRTRPVAKIQHRERIPAAQHHHPRSTLVMGLMRPAHMCSRVCHVYTSPGNNNYFTRLSVSPRHVCLTCMERWPGLLSRAAKESAVNPYLMMRALRQRAPTEKRTAPAI
jgi:hypothetical protein